MSKKKSSKSKKDIEYGCKKITPRTSNQSKYLKSIKKDTITFGIGPAGTGKTILSIDYAINQIIKERYKKIIITRPIVEAGEKLGFLPGDIQEKVDPYIRPMIDYIEDIIGPKWKSWYNEHVEVAPLAFMRGRTFNDCILIFDESQNSTREQMKMFLTRIGENSKAILTADPTQIDLNKNESGILEVIKILKDKPSISICEFDHNDVIRSEIVKTVINAYQDCNKSIIGIEEV